MGENSPSLVAAAERTARRAEAKNAGTKEPLEAPRVLFVVPDAATPPVGALKAQGVLNAAGYDLTWLTPAEVLGGKVLATPDVVVLDSGLLSLGSLCLHLKSEKQDASRGALDRCGRSDSIPCAAQRSSAATMRRTFRTSASALIAACMAKLT